MKWTGENNDRTIRADTVVHCNPYKNASSSFLYNSAGNVLHYKDRPIHTDINAKIIFTKYYKYYSKSLYSITHGAFKTQNAIKSENHVYLSITIRFYS